MLLHSLPFKVQATTSRGDGQQADLSDTLLGSLLGPQPGAEAFVRDYWQKMPSVIRRRNAAFFRDLIGADDVHAILADGISLFNSSSSVPEHGTDWRLVRRVKGADGEWWSSSPAQELSKTLNANTARTAFGKGFSVVINNLEERWEPLLNFANSFEDELGYRCGINMYFSPAQSQGFEVHFDWMDVFVLQVEGRKNWKLYDALLMLPRPDLKFKPTTAQAGKPFAEFVLEPGDLLYIPAGIVHEAHTVGLTEASLHLSVGAESTVIGSWESLLLNLVAKATEGASPEAELMCPKSKLTLGESLSAPVPQAEFSGLRWGDLLTALIVHAAAQDARLRAAVPLTMLTLRQQPKKNAVAGLKECAEALKSNAGLLPEALGDLRQNNGSSTRSPPLPSGLPLFSRLESSFSSDSRSRYELVPGHSRTNRGRSREDVDLPEATVQGFKAALQTFLCVLKSAKHGPSVLKFFRQAIRKDLEERRLKRKENLGKCRYRRADYFVLGNDRDL